ncbi:MAG: AMP-binding protein, partial [Aeromicrobium sp.]
MTQPSKPALGNLSEDILDRLPAHADDVALARLDGDSWIDVTLGDFHRDVTAVAKGLLASGVAAGDRVALLSKTRYEWTVADYAIWWTGAATVPIYETSSASQIAWILSDSGAVAAIVETDVHLKRVDESRPEAPDLGKVWTIDGGGLDQIRALGAGVTDEALEERRAGLTSDTLATLIYTSGTTGRPKGCRLTHGNFRYELDAATQQLTEMFEAEGASTLLFLPLAHVFARVIQVGAIRAGSKLGHTADVKDLVEHLGTFHPTFILAVPRVFEKVFNSASGKAYADGKGKIFDRAAATAIAYSRSIDTGKRGLGLRARHALFDRLVYGKLRAALGGEAQWALSGGAPLGDRLAHFYRGIGVTIYEGYGLTETCAGITVNRPGAIRVGTVGQPVGDVTVKIAEDGELLAKSPLV